MVLFALLSASGRVEAGAGQLSTPGIFCSQFCPRLGLCMMLLLPLILTGPRGPSGVTHDYFFFRTFVTSVSLRAMGLWSLSPFWEQTANSSGLASIANTASLESKKLS